MKRKQLGRPTTFQDGIYSDLRDRIVGGTLNPGDRFPTRRKLCREFDASTVTIQLALERLMADGFVETHGTRGTFVTPSPPHLTRYALVFPAPPESNRFWMALNNEALRLRHSQGVDLATYWNIDGHSDRKEYRQLVEDVEHHRLAGLIFAASPFLLEGTPLLDEPGIPRTAIASGDVQQYGCIRVDGLARTFISHAIDIVEKNGRQRVALILPTAGDEMVSAFTDELATRGFATPAWWVQTVQHSMPGAARNLAHLLAKGTEGERPDALIIANDNLVEAATEGLVDAGISVPDDLLVVAHCNFPWPPGNRTPVTRIGHDAREYLNECLAAIDSQRQGHTPQPIRLVSAILEEDAPATASTGRHEPYHDLADPLIGMTA